MLFIFLSLFFIFIILMSEDYSEKKLRKEAKQWKKITGRDYYE